jgi:DNA-binding FrmR family transcriptional regulator
VKTTRASSQPPSVLAVKKSIGTLQKVIAMVDGGKSYAAVIQQIDAAIGLATAAKRQLMGMHLEKTLKESKNPKKLFSDLLKLYQHTR